MLKIFNWSFGFDCLGKSNFGNLWGLMDNCCSNLLVLGLGNIEGLGLFGVSVWEAMNTGFICIFINLLSNSNLLSIFFIVELLFY